MEHLYTALHRMDRRVRELGLARYDPTDALSHRWFVRLQTGRRKYNGYYALRLLEFFAPISCRRVLGITPVLVPSTLFHLGMTYLAWERLDAARRRELARRADQMCEQALGIAIPGRLLAWEHPYDMHAADWRRADLRRPGVPNSCCHHTTRLGLLLLRVGCAHGRDDFINAARGAADALLEYHDWHFYEDGTCAVSYYPDTDDETINTGAEAAVLLASLPEAGRTAEHVARATGLAKMVVCEQQQRGQWKYATRRHEQRLGNSGQPDNHHTAMNLTSLAELLGTDVLENDLRSRVRASLQRGVRYYLNTFVGESGRCINEVGLARQAEIAGYCEGVKMLATVVDGAHIPDTALTDRCLAAIPMVLEHAYRSYYDVHTGDVACSRRFGRKYQVRSIRWGAGLLMEATVVALALAGRMGVRVAA